MNKHTFQNSSEMSAELSSIGSLGALKLLFQQATSELGFSLLIAMKVSEISEGPTVRILFGHGFERWYERYERMNYATHDCMVHELRRVSASYFWSEVLERRQISNEAQKMLDDVRELGLREGFVAPLHRSGRSFFAVMMAGAECDWRDPRTRRTADFISTCYGTIGAQIGRSSPQGSQVALLTARQRDCLRWVGQGKSSTDIGAILGISAEVVDEHIQNACRRLGVRTRTQAAILVSDLGSP